jgi:hypothetical protein
VETSEWTADVPDPPGWTSPEYRRDSDDALVCLRCGARIGIQWTLDGSDTQTHTTWHRTLAIELSGLLASVLGVAGVDGTEPGAPEGLASVMAWSRSIEQRST